MKKVLITYCAILLGIAAHSQLIPNLGGQRAGSSTLSFLKADVSPRSVGMGGSSVAFDKSGYSLANNPAPIVDLENLTFAISDRVYGEGMHQTFLSGIYPVNEGGSLGFLVNSLTSGEMEVRTEFKPKGNGRKFYVNNSAFGVSYSQKFSDRFNAGVTLKYIYEKLDKYTNHTAAFDLGFLYKTDMKDLKFSVVVKNFGINSSLNGSFIQEEFNRTTGISTENFSIPTVFKIGVSMKPYIKDDQSLLVSAQLNHPNDNAENIRIGAEYQYLDMLYGRLGYMINIEGQTFPTLGIGYKTTVGRFPLTFDYSIEPTDFLGTLHQIGFIFSITDKVKQSSGKSETENGK
ncbi:MAG: PorV/PorQ family protein [Flavobacteriales bacterium]